MIFSFYKASRVIFFIDINVFGSLKENTPDTKLGEAM